MIDVCCKCNVFLFELIFKKYFIWKETLDIQIGTVSVIFKIALIL